MEFSQRRSTASGLWLGDRIGKPILSIQPVKQLAIDHLLPMAFELSLFAVGPPQTVYMRSPPKFHIPSRANLLKFSLIMSITC